MNFFLLHIIVLQDDRIMTTITDSSQIDALQDPDSSVQEVDLRFERIGNTGATALANALKVNLSVQELCLSGNQIGNMGATALADALKVNTSVQELDLRFNEIGGVGATVLADALKVNASVQALYLNFNKIGDVGTTVLANALKVNASVQRIWVNSSYEKLFRQSIDIRNTVREMIDVLPLPTAGGHVVMYEWIAEYAF